MKIGIMVPTANRPHLIRSLVLQLENQTMKPSVVCIFKNGNADDYKWVISDLKVSFKIEWISVDVEVNGYDHYRIPLEYLLSKACTHFFWCDDDDIYFSHHIEESVRILNSGYDFNINKKCGLFKIYDRNYTYSSNFDIPHDPGGHCSSISFNADFARSLAKDLFENINLNYSSDMVLAHVTMLKHKCCITDTIQPSTTAYVCHSGTISSSHWLKTK